MIYLLFICLLLLIIFLLVNHFARYSLFNSLCLYLFLIGLSLTIAYYGFDHRNYLALIYVLIVFIIFMIVILFGAYIGAGLLLINAKIVSKKENSSLANSLTLILGIGLIIYIICSIFFFIYLDIFKINKFMQIVFIAWQTIGLVISFFIIHFILVMTNILLVNLFKPHHNYKYLIILGAGLINGKVSPLLASRIDRAIFYYQTQKNNNQSCFLIFSGGQGHDEPCSEALAMQTYALEKGVNIDDCILEQNSTTTYQNMLFSKQIISQDNSINYEKDVLFVTSNYHLYRGGLFARKVGLKIQGLGSKTAFYFLPNALIREYFAIFWNHKKRNIIVLLTISLLHF
ncbi:MAG: YdcF family protein, partial [Bacilli bacterium]|nr:YdcF family protein [Bacilli bacterium]